MNPPKQKISIAFLAGIFFLLLIGFSYPVPSHAEATISINVAPNIINLESTDHIFGIHTNVNWYTDMCEVAPVALLCGDEINGYEITPVGCHPDSHGNLIANFYSFDLGVCEPFIDDNRVLELTLQVGALESNAGYVIIIEKQPSFGKKTIRRGTQ